MLVTDTRTVIKRGDRWQFHFRFKDGHATSIRLVVRRGQRTIESADLLQNMIDATPKVVEYDEAWAGPAIDRYLATLRRPSFLWDFKEVQQLRYGPGRRGRAYIVVTFCIVARRWF